MIRHQRFEQGPGLRAHEAWLAKEKEVRDDKLAADLAQNSTHNVSIPGHSFAEVDSALSIRRRMEIVLSDPRRIEDGSIALDLRVRSLAGH